MKNQESPEKSDTFERSDTDLQFNAFSSLDVKRQEENWSLSQHNFSAVGSEAEGTITYLLRGFYFLSREFQVDVGDMNRRAHSTPTGRNPQFGVR